MSNYNPHKKIPCDLLDTNLNEARASLNWLFRSLFDDADRKGKDKADSHYKRVWAALDELEKWHGVSHNINMQLLYPSDE